MKGAYQIRVKNNRNSYTFELKRNISILRGESGRGKTTLFDMIYEFNRFGKSSGVAVSCDRELIALSGDDWESIIAKHPGTIIVIDEDSQFIRSKDFARVLRGSDNYFLLITRNYLADLPISVDEIYELNGAKNKKFKKVYQDVNRMFDRPTTRTLPFVPEVIITEDIKSGYQFFKAEAEKMGIQCVSADGKSKIFDVMSQYSKKNVVVIADGAAFGAEIADVVEQQSLRPRKLAIFLPESFEWLVLQSGIVKNVETEKMEHPEDYADSTLYMSWEQYFTAVLTEATKDVKYMKYKKARLSDFYMQEKNAAEIKKVAKGIKWE